MAPIALQWSWSPRDVGKLVGVVTSGARASMAPVRISKEFIDYVRDEMLALVDDPLEGRRYLGAFKSSVKNDLALDAHALPTIFDPDMSHSYSAPMMVSHVEVFGEIDPAAGLSVTFSIPRPGSLVYVVENGEALARALRLPSGLRVSVHKFSGLQVDMSAEALRYHVAVLGATGTGKSRLTKAIVEEALRLTDYSVVIFDHTGRDYVDATRWGPLGPAAGLEVIDASELILGIDVIAEMLAEYMGLSSYHEEHLYGIVAEYVSKRVSELLARGGEGNHKRPGAPLPQGHEARSLEETLKAYVKLSAEGLFKWDFNGFLQAAERYLRDVGARRGTYHKYEVLLTARVGREFFERYLNRRRIIIEKLVEDLFSRRRLIVVDLSAEPEHEAKNYIVYQFLRSLWSRIAVRGGEARALVVIDEAHNYCCERGCEPAKGIVAKSVREGRKWGLGVVLTSQRIIDLAPEIRGNVNTVFFSRLQTAGDYNELRNWIEGAHYAYYTLPLLGQREFYFAGLGNPLKRPLLVKVRDVS